VLETQQENTLKSQLLLFFPMLLGQILFAGRPPFLERTEQQLALGIKTL
jgi:hypothetical protein